MDIRENVELAPFTTFQVGGQARYFCELYNEADLPEIRTFAAEKNVPIFVLGGGSNIVISDQGFPGLVIHNRITKISEHAAGEKTIVTAGAGENWDALVECVVNKNLYGLEMLSGIPGTVGAAPVQNIGAYGASMDEAFVSLRAFDLVTGEFREFHKSDCDFAYRASRFKFADRGRYVITTVSFELSTQGSPTLSYHDLAKYFEGKPSPSLPEIRKAVIEIRARKGMVIRPEFESYKSVGSFFKNPVVSKEDAHRVKELIEAEKEKGGCNDPWFWFQPEGSVKLAVACLIERAGFPKGTSRGKVGISPVHSLAIINKADASAQEITGFVKKIQSAVKDKFDVAIEPEAEFIGF